MVAILVDDLGWKFSGYVCEDKTTAEKFIHETLHWINPDSFQIVPVTYVYTKIETKTD